MSQYCDPPDFAAPGVTDDRKAAFCQEASGLADGRIKKRYGLPLLAWGTDLRGSCARIARYLALADRGMNPSNPGDMLIVKGYDDAVKWLADIATGDAELVDAVDSTATVEEASPLVSSEPRQSWLFATSGDG